MKLMPVEKMALGVLGWGALALLSFFFHIVAFVVVVVILCLKALEFKFVYENTRDINTPTKESYASDGLTDSDRNQYYLDVTTDDLYVDEPFPELGAEWEGRLRENLPEGKGRWNKRVLG